MNKSYYPVIGLEVHVELTTVSKMFCSCPADHFAKKPNTQVCPICLGLPGALPYVNREAIDSTVKLGFALDCKIAEFSKFDRKHYFYPDLPKGYQISQYDLPLCKDGNYKIQNTNHNIRIRRIHLEEDTGKLVHSVVDGKKVSLIDFNRSGVPLAELVTEPDFENVELVVYFLKEIQRIVRYLGISTADMEKGSMRLEANISLAESRPERKSKEGLPDYKVELKNINSFRFLEKAIKYEIERQSKLLSSGKKITQETRGYDENKDVTFSQRTKEEAQDYRYFAEPDLPPMILSAKVTSILRDSIPEFPEAKRQKYKKLGLPENYIEVLVEDQTRAEYFETATKLGRRQGFPPKKIADAMVNLKLDKKVSSAEGLILELVKVSKKQFLTGKAVEEAVEKVLIEQKEAVEDYKKGKVAILGYLIGAVQRKLEGKADPKEIRKILSEKLS